MKNPMEGADAIVERAEVYPAAPRNILLLSKMEVTRKGRAPDTFTRSESPAATAGLLRPGKRGHRFVEYFHGDAVTKFYFDSERYYKTRPEPEVEEGYLAEVRDAMDVIVEVLGGACPQNEVTYAIAQRHGLYVPDIKKGKKKAATATAAADADAQPRYKLSFRTFVSGVAMVYHHIPHLMENVTEMKETLHLWDPSVYKRGEQLLGAIGGHKTADDRRVLLPLGGSADALNRSDDAEVLRYVASYVDPSWQVANIPDDDEGVAEGRPRQDRTVEGGDGAGCCPRVLALVRMLSAATAADRQEWVRVAILLKQLGGGGDVYLEPWLAFSRLAKDSGYVDDADCVKTWKSLVGGAGAVSGGRRPLTLGTLCRLAKIDDPEAYRRWQREGASSIGFRLDPEASGCLERLERLERPEVPPVARRTSLGEERTLAEATLKECAIAQAIRATVPGKMDGGVATFRIVPEGIRFELGEYRGLIDPKTYEVQLDSGEKLGPLFREFEIKENVSFAHGSLPRDCRFGCLIESELEATLKGKSPHLGTTMSLINMNTNALYAIVNVPEKKAERVRSSTILSRLMDVVSRGRQNHAACEFGITNNLFLNIAGDVHLVQGGRPRPDIRSDDTLAEAWMAVYNAASDDDRGVHRLVYTGSGYCYFDGSCGLWKVTTLADIACNRSLIAMKNLSEGAFYGSLNAAEKKYVGSIRGGFSVFRRTLDNLFDTGFTDRLDANMRIFPFDNGVYDLDSKAFRPLRWDDHVTFTAGYSLPASVDEETAAFVDEFYRQVLPVAEERELVLRMAGSTLCGMPFNKKFLVLQDRRGGDNGKSMVLDSFNAALGKFAVPTQLNFLTTGRCPDANGQQSATLLYRGKRLAIFDETDPELRMDMTRLKSITGGVPNLTARGMYDKKSTEFFWTAFVMIGCNENCLPKINSADAAFMRRMVTVPMRSKFCDKAVADGEPLAFPAIVGIKKRLRAAAGAVMRVLMAAFERYVADGESFGDPSKGCDDLKASVMLVSDPKLHFVAGVVDKVVDFVPAAAGDVDSCSNYVRRKHLLKAITDADKESNILRTLKVADVKAMLDKAMAAHQRELYERIKSADGSDVYRVYKDCVLRCVIPPS